jgi:hypothetical protein
MAADGTSAVWALRTFTMSLNAGWVELNDALKKMRQLWDETKQDWNDPASRDFEEHGWQPLEAHVVAALRAIDRLAPVLARAQRDCS